MAARTEVMVNRQGPAHPSAPKRSRSGFAEASSVRRRLFLGKASGGAGLGWKLMTSAAVLMLAAGCNKTSKKEIAQQRLAAFNYSKQAERPPLKPNHPLYIATTHWARKHQKSPSDPEAALNYARNLKALGSKDKAIDVLARTYQLNPGHGELASEYGRLALDLGKTQFAEQLLGQAMRTRSGSDWRVLSAMGTVNAKRGDHKQAQGYYLAALKQKPDATSVYNNLALSYALDGKAGYAEDLLKKAVEKGHNTRVVRQNLALVLNLQSKFEEAEKVAQMDLDDTRIDSNTDFMRKMVKTEVAEAPKPETHPARKADPVVTASLPARRPTPRVAAHAARAHAAPATASKAEPKPVQANVAGQPPAKAVQVTVAAQQSPVQTAPARTPLPARKPEPSIVTASAPAKAAPAAKEQKSAESLPWRKTPPVTAAAAPLPTRMAGLQPANAGAPTSILPQAAPDWSISVSAPAAQPETAAPAPAATAKRKWNPFAAN